MNYWTIAMHVRYKQKADQFIENDGARIKWNENS